MRYVRCEAKALRKDHAGFNGASDAYETSGVMQNKNNRSSLMRVKITEVIRWFQFLSSAGGIQVNASSKIDWIHVAFVNKFW